MFEDIVNALQNFKQNKIRTFLSLLGIIIGVASVIIITTLGQSATANITATFGDSGLNQLTISKGFMSRFGSAHSNVNFDEEFREYLWDGILGLKAIYYTNSLSSRLRLQNGSEASVNSTAVEYEFLEACGASLASGQWFSISDNVMGAQKIIVGSDIAESLFPDGNGVGENLILDSGSTTYGFTVVGILEDKDSGMVSTQNAAYIPRGFYMKKIKSNPTAQQVLVHVFDEDKTSIIAENITAWVNNKTGSENVVSVRSMASMIEKVDETLGTISLLLAGIAGISLLVGGIGIMNIMIVTVVERRKEIGIRKALGATPFAIRSQFLVEAAAITLLGGFLGIVFGIALSGIATNILGWRFDIKWGTVLFSFVFSAFVGVFFGFNPAARAAKLDPVIALASE